MAYKLFSTIVYDGINQDTMIELVDKVNKFEKENNVIKVDWIQTALLGEKVQVEVRLTAVVEYTDQQKEIFEDSTKEPKSCDPSDIGMRAHL